MSTKIFNEIYLVDDPTIGEVFNTISREERIFIYYMYRANLPFIQMARDQNGYYNNQIINLFEFLYEHQELIDDENFLNDVKIYLVYLWTNNGIYFLREYSNNKRTPQKINLKYLNAKSLDIVLKNIGCWVLFEHLIPIIFDDNYKPDLIIKGSIEKSGNNFYGPGFKDEHYEKCDEHAKNAINAYFSLYPNGEPQVTYYGENGKYGIELSVSIYWLKLALALVKECPLYFDNHIVYSLELLIEYFQTGNEEKFKLHSTEWLKTCSRIDYTLGFIETYNDPKSVRGDAGGDITIKTADMEKLKPILLDIETRLPYPKEYMRTEMSDKIMNVSVNRILFSSGHYGPLVKTAAYCLPNYEDIRSNYGSKQIIYKMPKGSDAILNKDLFKQFKTTKSLELLEKYDPDDTLYEDIWDLQVILHETIGHASGKLHKHTFVKGDILKIGNKEYNYGDTIDVTKENLKVFLGTNISALEELRAEINALYMAITEVDLLSKEGLFKNWPQILGKEELQKHCIISMAKHIFRRYLTLEENFKEIIGAHTMANVVITNCLLDGGGIRIIDEIKNIDGKEYHLLGIDVVDFDKALESIISLVRFVQHTKSTGNTILCKHLFDTYLTYPISIEQANLYRSYLEENRKKLVGNIKATSRIYPSYVPILENGILIDVKIAPAMDVFEQNMFYKKIMMSKEIC